MFLKSVNNKSSKGERSGIIHTVHENYDAVVRIG
jgi:hypothetical protein